MIIVADSSPFVVLVAIGHVDALPLLFGEVFIPPEVESELRSAKRSEAVRAFIWARPGWLRVQGPQAIIAIGGLHPGEVAAIALAEELHADRVIMDDVRGRQAAAQRGLQVIGTVGLLEVAADRDLLDLAEAFQKVKQTDFWVSPAFFAERLTLFRERRRSR
jgi:predicted nucleic acid-binding protein